MPLSSRQCPARPLDGNSAWVSLQLDAIFGLLRYPFAQKIQGDGDYPLTDLPEVSCPLTAAYGDIAPNSTFGNGCHSFASDAFAGSEKYFPLSSITTSLSRAYSGVTLGEFSRACQLIISSNRFSPDAKGSRGSDFWHWDPVTSLAALAQPRRAKLSGSRPLASALVESIKMNTPP